jgi:spermidine/putrescine ABC transporter ATP-binding subunit
MHALNDIFLDVPPGSLLTLLGPSGCGKSTLLRIIAGFLGATEGRVLLDNVDVSHVPPAKRETAMVFQNYALFPHMSIVENVMFGLRMRKVGKTAALQRANEALEMVRLSHLAQRMPAQLSGGQQQRAALARALVTDPKILLLDEPFGALDKNLREEMQVELKKLQQDVGVTTVCVTHDQQEAMAISDYIAVMNHGVLEQLGTPLEIYDRPTSHFVSTFIGRSNIFACTVVSSTDGLLRLRLRNGQEILLQGASPAQVNSEMNMAVRPGFIAVLEDGAVPAHHALVIKGSVSFATNLGNSVIYEVDAGLIGTLIVEQSRRHADALHVPGAGIRLALNPADCIILER